MKPKEFDELVRQKFDQNDFAYSPKNWDMLAEQLDGRAKKRSMIMWLWMPALGMAASVALAIGITGMLRFNVPANDGEYTQTSKFVKHQPAHEAVAMVTEDIVPAQAAAPVAKSGRMARVVKNDKTVVAKIGLSLNNIMSSKSAPVRTAEPVSLAAVPNSAIPQSAPHKTKKTEPVPPPPGYNTFAPHTYAAVKKPVKFSIILSGGINQGSHTSGYAAGATVRRMLNDKVFVEGDVAFASSDFMQSNSYSGGAPAAKVNGAKLSKVESGSSSSDKTTTDPTHQRIADLPYNLHYVQVTPSVGCKIINRMSVAAGPDFQQALGDNRPDFPDDYRGNKQQAPLFDVGLVGKTEYKLTSKVKAAVCYRKGINDMITPNKYINTDYLQFQLKCVIFNK